MIIHKENPSIIGFAPEDFICSIDNPAPTKNKVRTNNDLELEVIVELSMSGNWKYEFNKIAPIKSSINQGILIFLFFPLNKKIDMIETGIIQSALDSFTVVATVSASFPYAEAAPTTELVSWMATALQIPNWDSVRLKKWPIVGKVSKAIEFRRNITPSEIEMSFSEASIMGEIAAIALPPQIAVPEDIRWDVFLFNFNSFPMI